MVLTRAEVSARYRAKNIDEYRSKKREYAKTPAQREKRRAYMRKWIENNRDKYNEYCRRRNSRRIRTPDQRHEEHIKRSYGLSKIDYLEMLAAQKEVCAICGENQARGPTGRWHVDHCHSTGIIRGLLCNWCNARLGWFEKHFASASGYLKKGGFLFQDGIKKARNPMEKDQKMAAGQRRAWVLRKGKAQ